MVNAKPGQRNAQENLERARCGSTPGCRALSEFLPRPVQTNPSGFSIHSLRDGELHVDHCSLIEKYFHVEKSAVVAVVVVLRAPAPAARRRRRAGW